jgi:hypothetical protein
MKDRESVAEVGCALFGALLLGALAVLLGGRATGGATRGRRRIAPPPAVGKIPPERHRALGAVSAR